MSESKENQRLEARARRAARRVGLYACKSRERTWHTNNRHGMQLVDGYTNTVIAGLCFELTPERVLEICAARADEQK